MKKNILSHRYQSIQPTAMGESDKMLEQFDDVIDFSLGDPDLTTDRQVIEQAFSDALAGHTHYTHFQGEEALRQEIVSFYKEQYDQDITIEQIMVTTSGCHAMWLALEAILNDGDEVLIHEPYFTPYPHQVRLTRGVPVFVPTFEEDAFEIDPAQLRAKITERTRALILNTPNNPTGACFRKENLLEIAAIAREHDLIVIADDIYTSFSFKEPFVPFRSLADMAERTLTIGSFSKDYAMTGWRIGYIIASTQVIDAVRFINENNVFTAPSVSQRAAIHALRARARIQPPMLEEYKRRLQALFEEVQRTPHMSMLEPMGSLYGFVNIKKSGRRSEEVAAYLLENAHVLTLPGNAFGDSGEGYLRFAITVGVETIHEAFRRIRGTALFSE